MRTLTTVSGRHRRIPDGIDNVVGLDPDGRVVVDSFGVIGGDAHRPSQRAAAFVFGLTLCCNASDKGTDDGVVCRGCYGTKPNADVGQYLFAAPDGSFPDLDPLVTP